MWYILIGVATVAILVLLQRWYDHNANKNVGTYYEVLQGTGIGQKPGKSGKEETPRSRRRHRRTTGKLRKHQILTEKIEASEESPQSEEQEPQEVEKQQQQLENVVIPIVGGETGDPAAGKDNEKKHQLMSSCSDGTDRLEGITYKTYLEAQQTADIKRERHLPQDWDSTMAYTSGHSWSNTTSTIAELDAVFQELDQVIELLYQNKTAKEDQSKLHPQYRQIFRDKVNEALNNRESSILDEFEKIIADLQLPTPPKVAGEIENCPEVEKNQPGNTGVASIEIWKKLLGFH